MATTKPPSIFQKFFFRPEFAPLMLAIGEIIVFTVLSKGKFLSASNISNLLAFVPELGMIALAMTLLMISGEFDLSVGSVFGFTPVLMWTLFNQNFDCAQHLSCISSSRSDSSLTPRYSRSR
jgi:simple sugar transport system permease protein